MGPETMEGGCLNSHPKVPDKDRTSQRPSKVSTGHEELLQQWFKIVETYTVRSLTFEKDRLPAIAGIAKVVGSLTGYSYKAGLWDEDLIRGLAWSVRSFINGLEVSRSSDYVAPSWSWASIPSRVPLSGIGEEVVFPDNFEAAEDTTVLETRLEFLSDDPCLGVSAGLLKIRGRCHSLEPKDYAEDLPYFDFKSDLHCSRTEDGVNRLLLLLGKEYLHHVALVHVALILEETDVHGTYTRVGFWKEYWGQKLLNGTMKSLTII